MATIEPAARGALAKHPAAQAFAREVLRVHRRYATEVVGAYSLCPFMKDPDTAFGHFCVMLDPEPNPSTTLDAILEAQSSVIHVIFPCASAPTGAFEKFAGSMRESLRSWIPRPPVMAVFHPELSGDFSTSHRLVGFVRRAPDPFIQLVPEGLHEGGTVFVDSYVAMPKLPAEQNFDRLRDPRDRERLSAALADIREDRDRSYAPFLNELLGRA